MARIPSGRGKGRPKGTTVANGAKPASRGRGPNKLSLGLRTAIADLCEKTFPTYVEKLSQVEDPTKYCTLWHQLAEYSIPRLARVEHTGEDGGPVLVKVSAEDEGI